MIGATYMKLKHRYPNSCQAIIDDKNAVLFSSLLNLGKMCRDSVHRLLLARAPFPGSNLAIVLPLHFALLQTRLSFALYLLKPVRWKFLGSLAMEEDNMSIVPYGTNLDVVL